MDKIEVVEEEKGIYYVDEELTIIIDKLNEIIDWINSQE